MENATKYTAENLRQKQVFYKGALVLFVHYSTLKEGFLLIDTRAEKMISVNYADLSI